MPFDVGSSPTLWTAGVVRWLPGLITLGLRVRVPPPAPSSSKDFSDFPGFGLRSLIGQNVRLSLGRIRVQIPSQPPLVFRWASLAE
jgi:hypothetical protein